jgi:hypothetical protein
MTGFQLFQAVVVELHDRRVDIDMNGRGFFNIEYNPAYRPQIGDVCWAMTRGEFPPWVLDKVRPACHPVVKLERDHAFPLWGWVCTEHQITGTVGLWTGALAEARVHARHPWLQFGRHHNAERERERAAIGWDQL